jgi:serine/threonine protein kinase
MMVTSEFCCCRPLYLPLSTLSTRYLILDILGQGTFGQVVKCQNMKTHEIVAVKVVKNKPAYFNQSMMEVTILELVSVSTNLSHSPLN